MAEQKMHGFRARLDYLLKHNLFINKCFRILGGALMKLWGLFVPVDGNMVLFSGHGRRYNDSPRALYEHMLANPQLYSKYKCVWALEDVSVSIPGAFDVVKADTIRYFKYSLKAKYWIACTNIERGLRYKKKNCVYLNTWHGVSLNAVGNGMSKRKDYDFSHLDFFCYESDWHKSILMKSFNAPEHIMLPSGLPRNDELYYVSQDEVKLIKDELNIPNDKKVILYAPTWRDSNDGGNSYLLRPPINQEIWEKALSKEYVLLIRTHAYTTKLLGLKFNDFIRDCSSYPKINNLFKISDILISDYSACITDYSILERPVICYAYDYDEYKKWRDLNFDFEQGMPSGVLRSEDEVITKILNMNFNEECIKTKTMLKDRLTYIGGRATEICLKALFSK